MFNPFEPISSLIKAGRDITSLFGDFNDTFRREAQRLIDAFKAHDLPPNEVIRLLPDELVGHDASVFERASTLKGHLKRVSPWAAATLQLDPSWIKGRTKCPHTRINSYKHFAVLREFFEQKQAEDHDMNRFILYVLKSDAEPMDRGRGIFVAILEEQFAELDGEGVHRFFHMTHGHSFENASALMNLFQLLALAHFYGFHCKGKVMKEADLAVLDECEGFIPDLWRNTSAKWWYPMDPLWLGMTGDQAWNESVRRQLEANLIRNGLQVMVDKLESDRIRLAR